MVCCFGACTGIHEWFTLLSNSENDDNFCPQLNDEFIKHIDRGLHTVLVYLLYTVLCKYYRKCTIFTIFLGQKWIYQHNELFDKQTNCFFYNFVIYETETFLFSFFQAGK